MPITVYSPFDGEPVKVRDQDAGRAVKDRGGRLFYVLPRSDGNGYYGATTRAGNPKEEARALEYESKAAKQRGSSTEAVQQTFAPARQKKGGLTGKLVILVLILIVAALAWAFTLGPLGWNRQQSGSPTPPQNPVPMDNARPGN